MQPSKGSRWSAASLLVSLALLGFLGWRAFSIAHRLPSLLRTDGVREGLSWPLEKRLQRAFAQAPVTGKSEAAENWAVLELLRAHVEEHALVLVDLERGRGGVELGGLLATLTFPRHVRPVRMNEVERAPWPELAGSDGLYALVRSDSSEPAWKHSAARMAKTNQHELWRLRDRKP